MPIHGVVPKPRDEIRHRVPAVHEWIDVPDSEFTRGPAIRNRERPSGEPWPRAALERWNVWRRMPHARLWTRADWAFAFDAIELFAQIWEGRVDLNGDRIKSWQASIMHELRDREKVMGTTIDYRRSLRIRYVAADTSAAAGSAGTVANIADYRQL